MARERRALDRERVLTGLLESSAQGIYGVDRDGQCIFANPAAVAMLGWTAEELRGRRLHDLVHHTHTDGRAYQPEDCRIMHALHAGAGVQVDDEVFWRRDGSAFPVEYTSTAIVTDGVAQGAVVTFTDISERRRTEQARRAAYEHERLAAAKLRELDEAKSNFLATVSHELRTPLTSLAGYLELLADGDVGPISDDQRFVLATMSRNADRLRALIEDLLTVSHIAARPLVLDLTPVNLGALVDEVYAPATVAAAERGHTLELDVYAALGAFLVDGTHLRRVVTSLLDNAIKCTPPGGRIVVGVRQVSGAVEISVADNGIGIDPHEVPRLFTRFFRTGAAMHLAIQGAGLSLAIARQIVDEHGGTINVQTSPGAGSTFTVRLPRRVPSPVPTSA